MFKVFPPVLGIKEKLFIYFPTLYGKKTSEGMHFIKKNQIVQVFSLTRWETVYLRVKNFFVANSITNKFETTIS